MEVTMGFINMRSEGLVNNLHEYTFHILGCGAIGSSAANQLVRAGATNLIVWRLVEKQWKIFATIRSKNLLC